MLYVRPQPRDVGGSFLLAEKLIPLGLAKYMGIILTGFLKIRSISLEFLHIDQKIPCNLFGDAGFSSCSVRPQP
jgi:hypothetical protein